jgi:hypothetical protein
MGTEGLGAEGLTDHRWEGYDDEELADVVDALRTGRGAESMAGAADTLDAVTDSLRQIDRALYEQLGAIGVHWQSRQAAGLAANAMGESRDYNNGAIGQVMVSARSVDDQGGAYEAGKRGMPDAAALRTQPKTATAAGITGNIADHTGQVRAKDQARQQAVDGLNNYGQASRRNLAAHQPLPPTPAVHVHTPSAPPVAGSSTAPSDYTAPSHYTAPPSATPAGPQAPGYADPVRGGFGPAPVSGGGPSPTFGAGPETVAGPGASVGGVPATGGALPAPGGGASFGGPAFGAIAATPGVTGGAPGSPGAQVPGGTQAPGARMGVAPVPPGTPGAAPAPGVAPKGFGPNAMNSAAMGAAIAGGAGATAAGAGGEQERLSKGGRGSAAGRMPTEETSAGRAASRPGSTGEQRRSVLQPATGNPDDEEDGEHVRRFGVESEDLFVDQRMVVTPVLGDDEDTAK